MHEIREFIHLNPVKTDYGSFVKIYESSAAEEPHIWLRITQPPAHPGALPEAEAVAHMSMEQAQAIHAQLGHMIQRTLERWA